MIRRDDRVSTVLREDESLIDVFVSLSPAFERLRNRAMRKVMSRLVTVEQAARMAGVDADELVARLNAHGDAEDREAGRATRTVEAHWSGAADPPAGEGDDGGGDAALPAALAAMPADLVLDVDVRDDLRNGREPFSRIMAARREMPDAGALRLRAIFEPVPLYAVMARQGFAHYTERLGAEDWRVWFFRAEDAGALPDPRDPTAARPGGAGEASDDAGADVVVLDVRGLEPPEPMVRTLAALESLPTGTTLVQINVRVPQFLLPLLDERGFAYEIREQDTDLVRVFIRRAGPE